MRGDGLFYRWDSSTYWLPEAEPFARLRGPRRVGAEKGPVLLVHGLGAASNTFEANDGGGDRSLAAFLQQRGFDVWLLDWRGSCDPVVQAKLRERKYEPDDFRLDAAEDDVVAAVEHVYAATGQQEVAVVGHCMGGAVVSQCLARGKLRQVDRVVLSTMALFYRLDQARTFLVNERLLLRLVSSASPSDLRPWLDPHDVSTWPPSIRQAFEDYRRLPPHVFASRFIGVLPSTRGRRNEPLVRVSFLYGQPFSALDLPNFGGEVIPRVFGTVNLDLFAHAADNARRGFADTWRVHPESLSDCPYDKPCAFRSLRRLLLVTGHNNRLWHRDSIDLMHDWLMDERYPRDRLRKVVFPRRWHQDLMWSAKAHEEVFEPHLLPALDPGA